MRNMGKKTILKYFSASFSVVRALLRGCSEPPALKACVAAAPCNMNIDQSLRVFIWICFWTDEREQSYSGT
jgi:hypothetical protein